MRTVREAYYALAAPGGHLDRASDGPPGWQTLWHGFVCLRQPVEGVHLAAQFQTDNPTKKAPT